MVTARTFGISAALLALLAGARSRAAGRAAHADPGHARAAQAPLAWTQAAPHPTRRSEALGAAVDGRLYVVGGYDVERPNERAVTRVDVLDRLTGAWSSGAPAPEALTHTPVVVDGRDIWLVGGFVGDSPGGATANVWVYDTDGDAWRPGPPLPARRGAGGAAIVGRTIHYFGGVDRPAGSQAYEDEDDHWALDLSAAAPAWRARAPLPQARNHLAGVGLGGRAYAIGGQRGGNQKTGNVARTEAYDPATDSWARVADLPWRGATSTRRSSPPTGAYGWSGGRRTTRGRATGGRAPR